MQPFSILKDVVREGLKKVNYQFLVDKRLTPPHLIHLGETNNILKLRSVCIHLR